MKTLELFFHIHGSYSELRDKDNNCIFYKSTNNSEIWNLDFRRMYSSEARNTLFIIDGLDYWYRDGNLMVV